MFNKILKLSTINIFTSLLNFLSTILIVKIFGLSVLGEFAIFNSFVGILMLLFIILPPNYSIFQLQDSKKYIDYLIMNILIAIILIFFIIFIMTFLLDINQYNPILSFFYIILLGILNFFDIIFQAFNQLNRYFIGLFFIAFFKIIILLLINLSILKLTILNLNILILINVISTLIAIIGFFALFIKSFNLNHVVSIKKYVTYIFNHFKILKSYYINNILKRLKDNSVILVFSLFASSYDIGILSLIIKVSSLVLGQVRIIEAFLMNRENLNKVKTIPFVYKITVQFLIILVGLIYLKINTNAFYAIELIIYSFMAYPYINIILARNILLSKYDNTLINKAYILYIIYILFVLLYFYIFKLASLASIISIIIVGEFFISIYLIKNTRKKT